MCPYKTNTLKISHSQSEEFLTLFAHEVYRFLKEWANFEHIPFFLNIYRQSFQLSHVCVPQNVRDVLI